MMTFGELRKIWYSDLYRYAGVVNRKTVVRALMFNIGFKYTFWMRLCRYLSQRRMFFPLFVLARFKLMRLSTRYGIVIPQRMEIGKGLQIQHYGGIFVNYEAKVGKNCTISQDVTIGQANRGKNKGCATIGDNVYICPGAKIVGAVKIGNNVVIGANCVVTKDIPDNAVVGGIPGKVISYDGCEGYVNNIDYAM